MNSGIFISYRRGSTAAFAGRLFDRLSAQFGKERTFMDVDGIEPGEDFVEVLESRLTDTVAMVVLIGRDWVNVKDGNGRTRLENPDDFVRLEVATALRRKVRVIPVLMDDAVMPTTQELPEDLAALSRRQAIEVSHAKFHQDVSRLVTVLEKLLKDSESTAENARRAEEAQQKVEANRLAEIARNKARAEELVEEARRKAEADRLAEIAQQKARADRLAQEARHKADQESLAAARRKAEADRLAEKVKTRTPPRTAEKVRIDADQLAEGARRKAEQDRLAEEAKREAEIDRLAQVAKRKARADQLAEEAGRKAEQERLAERARQNVRAEQITQDARRNVQKSPDLANVQTKSPSKAGAFVAFGVGVLGTVAYGIARDLDWSTIVGMSFALGIFFLVGVDWRRK
jgi:TIR domain